ncbi:MAG: DUF4124 domain-containing protein [Giesbergeria sp.]
MDSMTSRPFSIPAERANARPSMAAGCNIGAHDIIFTSYCQRKNKIFNTLLKICVLWALLVPATAQMYKWVDEKGTTHYGERPPAGKKARKVEEHLANPTPAPGTPVEPGWKDKELEFRGRRIEAEQAQTKQKQQEATHREACNQARDLLVQAKSAQRLYQLNEKGERVYQSEEEHQASVAQMERLIAQRCR